MDVGIQPSTAARKTVLRIARRPPLRIGRMDGVRSTFPIRRPALRLTRAAVAGSAIVHAAVLTVLLQIPGVGDRVARASNEIFHVVDLGRRVEPERPPPPPPPPEPPSPPPKATALTEIPPDLEFLPAVAAAVTNPPPAEARTDSLPAAPVFETASVAAEPAMAASDPAEPATGTIEDGAAWDAIRAAIHKHIVYPDSARRRGEEGRVMLVLTVAADGALEHADALADGASRRLASAALSAARRAAPFDPSARGEFRIPVVFRLTPSPRPGT